MQPVIIFLILFFLEQQFRGKYHSEGQKNCIVCEPRLLLMQNIVLKLEK